MVELKPWFSGKRLRAWQTGETRDKSARSGQALEALVQVTANP